MHKLSRVLITYQITDIELLDKSGDLKSDHNNPEKEIWTS